MWFHTTTTTNEYALCVFIEIKMESSHAGLCLSAYAWFIIHIIYNISKLLTLSFEFCPTKAELNWLVTEVYSL
jgi:hypothetical protein